MSKHFSPSDNDDGDGDFHGIPPELRELMENMMRGNVNPDELPTPFRTAKKIQETEELQRHMALIANLQIGVLTMFGNDEEIVTAWEGNDSADTALMALRSIFESRIALGKDEADNHHYSAFMCGLFGRAIREGLVTDKDFDIVDYHDEVEHTHLPGRQAVDKRLHRLRTAVTEAYVRVQRDGRLTTLDDKPFNLLVESDDGTFDRVLTYNGDAFGTAAPLGANRAWAVVGEGGILSTPEGEPFTLMVSFDKGETYEQMVRLDKAVTPEEEVRFVNTADEVPSWASGRRGGKTSRLRQDIQEYLDKRHTAVQGSSLFDALNEAAKKVADAMREDGILKESPDGTPEIFVTNLSTGERYEVTDHGLEPRIIASADFTISPEDAYRAMRQVTDLDPQDFPADNGDTAQAEDNTDE